MKRSALAIDSAVQIGGWPDDSIQPAVNNHANLSAPMTGNRNNMSYYGFRSNAIRLRPDALAYNLGKFLRFLALPQEVECWPIATLLELLIKIGARVIRHDRCIAYPQGEFAISRTLLADVRRPNYRLRSAPLPSRQASVHKYLSVPTEERQNWSVEVCPPITRLAAYRPYSCKIDQQTEEIATQRANQDLNRLRQPILLRWLASVEVPSRSLELDAKRTSPGGNFS